VTPRSRINFYIDDEQHQALQRLRERDGIPEAEQIRRAIDGWLKAKGMKADRRRGSAVSASSDARPSGRRRS
jgi:hypothetical protein